MRIPPAGGQNGLASIRMRRRWLTCIWMPTARSQETSPVMYKVPGKSSFPLGTGPIMAKIERSGAVLAVSNDRGFTASTATATRRWSGRFHSQSVGRMFKTAIRAIFVTDSGAWAKWNIFDAGYRPRLLRDLGSSIALGGYFHFASTDSQQFYVSAIDNGSST